MERKDKTLYISLAKKNKKNNNGKGAFHENTHPLLDSYINLLKKIVSNSTSKLKSDAKVIETSLKFEMAKACNYLGLYNINPGQPLSSAFSKASDELTQGLKNISTDGSSR